ncbi:ABC transporter ATP-binding protein [bacterium K02(2017)]|nr:ABC transporter ATP-binding protein [bacterium K02(2017)]
MSVLISIQNLSKAFGTQTLFENISFGIHAGERLGLIGPNGTGKSTLLKILMQIEDADEGDVINKKGLRLAYLTQTDNFKPNVSIEEALIQSLNQQHDLDEMQRNVKVQKFLSLLEFEDAKQKVNTLSGGWRKRLAISCCLIQEPDVLLMDEPTNHLDINGVIWLEGLLKISKFAFVVITHDRYFLENTTNRIIELSPRYQAGFLKTEGNYSDFLENRELYISEQEKKEASLSNKVRNETEWLRRGPKARTTKAKYRINETLELQSELSELKQRNRAEKSVNFDFEANEKKSKLLIKTHQISKSLGDKNLIQKLSIKISPGMKIGLVGSNGSGKSTLMKLLSGKLKPDEGTIKLGLDVKVINFEQDRTQLNPKDSVKDSLSLNGSDTVIYRDKPIHIITWAKRFLFKPEQLESPVSTLSGGEQARILIARLMQQPADVLLLDEPTNDLDIPSLEILEKTLLEFTGALILVTHDRYLIDRITNQIYSLDGFGNFETFADINQWLKDLKDKKKKEKKASIQKETKQVAPKLKQRKKLTYKDQYELDHMEENIQKIEGELSHIKEKIQDPKIISKPDEMNEWCQKLNETQEIIDKLYARWDELETLSKEN